MSEAMATTCAVTDAVDGEKEADEDAKMLSDELVSLREPGERAEAEMPKEVKAPDEPSDQERRWHELTHCP